jgi:hypothetical protein
LAKRFRLRTLIFAGRISEIDEQGKATDKGPIPLPPGAEYAKPRFD